MKKKLIEDKVAVLKGMRLAASFLAADMRVFHFCLPEEGYTLTTALCLHIQCPWRIEQDDRIITGRYDYWEPLTDIDGDELETWDPDKDGNLQAQIMESFLKEPIFVSDVRYAGCGGIILDFSNHTKLTLFPQGAKAEDWRLFRKDQETPHLVVSGGEIHEWSR